MHHRAFTRLVRLSLFLAAIALPGLPIAAKPVIAPPASQPAAPAFLANLTPEQALARRRSPIVEVFQACKDGVVNIASTQIVQVRSPWDDFFDAPGRQYRQTSVGSGFVLHPAGYIVTNAHVVARTVDRKVVFADKREFAAQIVALDQERDLAVLKIESPQPLKPLALGRSDDLMVGETAIAIGNPMGYQHTCTAGVVSALDRSIELGEGVTFTGLIQTDASINPGNSGGPLLNVLGQLIGVNTAIRGDAQNIGFAIPVDRLRAVLPEMLDVERRYHIVAGLTLAHDGSCRVETVVGDSPAAKAGLRPGDVVKTLAGQVLTDGIDYYIALLGRKAGEALALTIARAGQSIDLTLTLAARPRPDGGKLLADKFGIQAQALTPAMSKAMGVEGLKGLLVDKVEKSSPAEELGLRRGDVILQLGRHPAAGLEDTGEILESVQSGQNVAIAVLRITGNLIQRSITQLKAR